MTEAEQLRLAAKLQGLWLLGQLATQMRLLDLTPEQIAERSGLSPEIVTQGMDSGNISFVDFMIIAHVIGQADFDLKGHPA